MAEASNIISINIEDEMRGAYIDYSMSVIVSRALPDVRDGFKPVHRRVLYAMAELGLSFNRPYKKSARIVGETLGKYHPHGDSSVYDTMVRMAQEWSLRYPLVDGQGNFGSMDGDSPAAMRYTEARLKEVAGEMLSDIRKETVDFQLNFDDSLEEPTVLPGRLPNLLVNGTSGIAVGMATNMAPHNLREVINGIVAYIESPEISVYELMDYVAGPDFPTGGIIYGTDGVRKALATGRGRVVIRAVTHFEVDKSGRDVIVITEMPYQVNKAMMIEKTAALVNEKKIEGIYAIRDESDRKGVRVVYELKKDAIPDIVLNTLFKHTSLQNTFSVNNIALVKGRPMMLNLKQMIQYYVEHRHEVVVRRTEYDLREAEKRLHILQGYLIALDHLDEVIKTIRGAADPEIARTGLIEKFELSEIQAKAILDMRLQRLTGLERDKIQKEHEEVMQLVESLNEILASKELRMNIIKDELISLKEKYGDERRTRIEINAEDIDIEDLIADDEMVITISNAGYIKRTPLTEYRQQGRGGVGSRGVVTKEDDFTEHLFVATSHEYLLIFTEQGKVFWMKVYQVPEGSKVSKGRPLQNLIQIDKEDSVKAVINVKNLKDADYINNNYLVMCTEKGVVKKTSLEAYSRPRQNGINAININEGDILHDVKMTNGDSEIVIALKSGRAIRFNEKHVRFMGRTATGVRGVSLANADDKVVGLVCVNDPETTLLVVSEKGFGKRSSLEDYRVTNRGGKGVKTINVTEKTGNLISMKSVINQDQLMIITKSGITIRLGLDQLRIMGRATQGVKLIRLNEGDEISSVAKIENMQDDIVESEIEIIEGENAQEEGNNVTKQKDDSPES